MVASCTGTASNFNWKEALEYVNSYAFPTATTNVSSYRDWRVPNLKELFSLIAYNRAAPIINLTIFPNTPNTFPDNLYLTSSPNGYGTVKDLDFSTGQYGQSSRDFENFSLRLARDNAR
jgi:hypothetical protein